MFKIPLWLLSFPNNEHLEIPISGKDKLLTSSNTLSHKKRKNVHSRIPCVLFCRWGSFIVVPNNIQRHLKGLVVKKHIWVSVIKKKLPKHTFLYTQAVFSYYIVNYTFLSKAKNYSIWPVCFWSKDYEPKFLLKLLKEAVYKAVHFDWYLSC